ncbi:glycoside hydrolase family 2 protein [Tunicatimonas pelagia]|uniref:glycoside hydrolase family 2 protein n=1 Tax=Tunicatimonas pelagia TaxID=931531 RepID=UPI002664F498|nr:glycoside hydrolase family 2 TIM barrel-domain containing protein [Tunicatimonas pelagia]WKN45000.1 glycoside hydrolase family 2 TIM barrel-domain containing protein [Tunicatimonas pelagia]
MNIAKLSGWLLVLLLPIDVLGQATQFQYLSGQDKDRTVDWEFKIDKGHRSGEWGSIAVPSNWELQGYGTFTYGRSWRDQLPDVAATGTYRHRFTVPSDWQNKTVNIVFEGSMTDTQVTLNGQSAGPVHQGSFYRFKHDVTQLLNYGEENTLEVIVKNVSDNASVNRAERDADFWIFGGIYRPVYLEAHPREHIDWTAIDARADGLFTLRVYPKNVRQAQRVEAQIQTLDGQAVGDAFSVPVRRRDTSVSLTSTVTNPALWSAEFPNRYRVRVSLLGKSETLHTLTETFGFRTAELRPRDGFYVNGQKVRFKGVNRHSAWPTSGRTTSRALSVQDAQLMKDMNMNAVRMSHYPPDKHFLEVCDSLGLFVIDELTGWQDAYDTLVGEQLVREMIVRDVNHPSVVMWANGNEGGHNYDLLDEYARYDLQQRLVIHPWNTINGANTLHYPVFGCCGGYFFQGEEVFFPTEFLHGLYDGGHGAGLHAWWNAMLNHPRSAGGFLWVFADEGVVRSDLNDSIDTNGSNAPDGIVGPFRQKEGSFYTIKEVWSPIHIDPPALNASFAGQLRIENRYHFTNLNQCTFRWQLIDFPNPSAGATDSTVVASGSVVVPSVVPGLSAYLTLELPDDWRDHHALYLTATDPHGRSVLTWTWPIISAETTARTIVPNSTGSSVAQGRIAGDTLYLEASDVRIGISQQNGTLTQVRNAEGPISLTNGPLPAMGEARLTSFDHFAEGDDYVAQFCYEGALDTVVYRLMGNGWLRLDYTYTPQETQPYVGMNFNYPENQVRGITWLGQGPYRVWKNRMRGTQFAVHHNDYNNTVTGESGWVYPEFKGYFAGWHWARLETDEQPFTVVSATEGLFLRLFTPQPPQGAFNEHTDGQFPEGDISVLDAISPIGTKFKSPDMLGPSGQPNYFKSNEQPGRLWGATLYFDFRGEVATPGEGR